MVVEVVKHIEVKLTEEEKETINKTREILSSVMEVMVANGCKLISCDNGFGYGDNSIYEYSEIDDIDSTLDNFRRIVEIF